ncbi:MAG: hypothetical protein NTY61_03090 [Candidatus Parcubacteria bacterium]|nr:hypothetical protein [Candidatus Parcubacteria bacterium]
MAEKIRVVEKSRFDDCPVCIQLGKKGGERGKIEREQSCMPLPDIVCPVCFALLNVSGNLSRPICTVTVAVDGAPPSPIFCLPQAARRTENKSFL